MMMIVLRLLSLLGLKSRWQRHFHPDPEQGVFSGEGEWCRWIRGLRARNPCGIGIQPVHTQVDSGGLQWPPATGDSTKRGFALEGGHHFPGEQLERALRLLERQIAEGHAAEAIVDAGGCI